jgi:hypothetical protein
LYLNNSSIKSLPKLESVGKSLYLSFTPIEDLGNLKYVGRFLDLEDTILSKTMTKHEMKYKYGVKGNIFI